MANLYDTLGRPGWLSNMAARETSIKLNKDMSDSDVEKVVEALDKAYLEYPDDYDALMKYITSNEGAMTEPVIKAAKGSIEHTERYKRLTYTPDDERIGELTALKAKDPKTYNAMKAMSEASDNKPFEKDIRQVEEKAAKVEQEAKKKAELLTMIGRIGGRSEHHAQLVDRLLEIHHKDKDPYQTVKNLITKCTENPQIVTKVDKSIDAEAAKTPLGALTEYVKYFDRVYEDAYNKAKANEGQENAGQENGGNSGNSGGRSGGNSGGSRARSTGKMTLDRACSYGPTALMEFIEKDLGHPIDASNKRKGKTGHDYVPTSKMKAIVAGLSDDERAKLEDYVNSDKFKEDVRTINERDQYTPSSRGGRANGGGDAGGNNGNDEAPEPVKAEKASTRGQAMAMGMAVVGLPVEENTAKLLDEEFAKQDAAKAAKEAKEAAEKARQEEIARCKKLYKDKPDEFAKEKAAVAAKNNTAKLAIMNEAERIVKAEERDTKFKKYKELLLKNPDMFKSAKETAKQNLDIPEARENLKLMEDVEKYVKLEKQMQKDLKKAKEKEEKAKKAYDKGKTEKGKKYDDKAKELRAEAGKLSEQMRELNPGEKQAAEPISATRAKELSEAMKKDKGKSKESLGNRILSAVGLKKGKEQGQQTAAQVLSAEAQTQTAAVGKKAVREVNGNVTKYTMSGVDNDDLAKTDLCNGTYIVTYKDGKPDTIQFTDGGNAPVITFEYKNDKEKAKTVQNLNSIFIKYNPEIALAMQKGNERG